MSVRRLVVTDATSEAWFLRASACDCPGQAEWCIFPIGVSVERYRWLHMAKIGALANASTLGAVPVAESAQKRLGQFYLSLMSEVHRRKLRHGKSLLSELAGTGFNRWWFLEISEKSALRGPVLNQLYAVALVEETVDNGCYDEVWICLRDDLLSVTLSAIRCNCPIVQIREPDTDTPIAKLKRKLSRAFGLSFFSRQLRSFLATLVQALAIRATGIGRGDSVCQGAVMLFTRFPTLWRDACKPTAWDSMHGHLAEELRCVTPVQYGALLETGLVDTLRHRRAILGFIRRHGVVILNRYWHLWDLLDQLSPARLARLLRVGLRFVPCVNVRFGRTDVSLLVREEIKRSLCSAELFGDELLFRAVSRLSRLGAIRCLIHSAEFQPYEKALWYGAGRDMRTIAFQHSTIGKNKLQYYFAPGEIQKALRQNGADGNMPLPDFVYVSGRFPHRVMLQNGFPEGKLAVCGAVRFQYLSAVSSYAREAPSLRERMEIPGAARVLLLTLGLQRADESMELVNTLLEAMADCAEDVHAVIRCHPLARVDGLIREEAGRRLQGHRLRVSSPDEPLLTLISLSDAVILPSSTTALEAAAVGKPAVIFEDVSRFPLGPVGDISRIGIVVRSSDEMAAAIRKVLAGGAPVEQLVRSGRKELSDVFSYLDGTASTKFVELMRSHDLV